MARLPVSGATFSTPFQDGKDLRVLGENDLRTALSEICPAGVFSADEIHKYYLQLGLIIGSWSAEQDRIDTTQLVKPISTIAANLDTIVKTLSALQGGLQHRLDIEIVGQLETILALDPEVGSRELAVEFLSSFRKDAAKMAHACLVAAHDLEESVVGKSGRPQSEWHDRFTALLLEIAESAGVEPRLNKDRISGARGGWLLDAARALETFLDQQMRSPSAEACGKRLERSKTRLKQRHRQKPSSV